MTIINIDHDKKRATIALQYNDIRDINTFIPASQPIDADFWGEEYAEAKGFDNASAEDSMT